MKIHNVFYISLLEPYNGRSKSEISLPLAIVVDDEKVFEVEEILDSRLHYGKLQYLVKWMGYPYFENSWQGRNNVAGASDLIELFHKVYPDKPDKSQNQINKSAATSMNLVPQNNKNPERFYQGEASEPMPEDKLKSQLPQNFS